MEIKKKIAFISSTEDLILWIDDRVLDLNLDKIVIFDDNLNHKDIEAIEDIKSKYKLDIVNISSNQKNSIFWNEVTKSNIKKYIREELKNEYNYVLTHSPDGEDGGYNSITLSQIVSDLNIDNLFFISIDYSSKYYVKKSVEDKIYRSFGTSSLRMILTYLVFKKIPIFSSILFRIFKNNLIELDLYNKLKLRKHIIYISSDKFIPYRKANLIKIKSHLNYVNNSEEYFLKYDSLLSKYQDRNYLAKQIYPKCIGYTLNVGCHEFNKWDFVLFRDMDKYHTIDIDKSYEKFGSPYFHKTIDYMDFNPELKYNNIILFGVLGLPDLTGPDKYTLHGKYNDVVMKSDSLLKKDGLVLFGPDIFHDPKNSNEVFWDDFFESNATIKTSYNIIEKKTFEHNLVYVFKKK